MVRKNAFVVTIVGAESSGKTVLAKHLAAALSCEWVPEFAREYLEKLDRPYEFEDLEAIARGEWDLIMGENKVPPSQEESSSSVSNEASSIPLPGELKDLDDLVKWLKSIHEQIVIIDAGMLTIRMWALIKYDRKVPFVEEMMEQDPTSIYLLCRPRMEWESDPLREAPVLIDRVWIFNQYLKEMVQQKFDFKILQR